MSDEEKVKKESAVKSYLGFIDTNVIFKKPVSFLFTVISFLIPVYFLIQIIQYRIFQTENAKLIVTALLLFVVLLFAGIFGGLIWWHRRIIRDEGPKVYNNFRRFVQTLGEWSATVFAIIVFFGVLILMIALGEDYRYIAGLFPARVPPLSTTLCLAGPVIGFLIIIGVKIFLFLLDPVVWLVKQIWTLLKRIVLYYYRCVLKMHTIIEQNTSVWIGVVWVVSILVTLCGLLLCFKLYTQPDRDILLGAVLTVALGLGFMGFLVIKRKNYDA